MTLLDILKLISYELFPPTLEKSKYSSWIDTRPQTVYKVTICFMLQIIDKYKTEVEPQESEDQDD